MLRTLDLIYTILKFSFLLAFLRLLATAFGWEFGVSRRYLRLLEFLFYAGQKRLEQTGEAAEAEARTNHSPQITCQTATRVEEDVNYLLPGSQPAPNSLPLTNGASSAQSGAPAGAPKSRRVSTPEGPPVFLLDDLMAEALLEEEEAAHEFQLSDACLLVIRGVAALIDDQVTKRFSQEKLKSWNLLTRTTGHQARNYRPLSRRWGLVWLVGVLTRYALLMPLRIMFTLSGFLWITSSMSLLGLVPDTVASTPKQRLYQLASLMGFRMLACGITSRLQFHNRQYRAKRGHICVANHTSPIDVVLLACDNCYALVGQRHGGLLGALECALSRAANHVWFDRAEMRDRQLVSRRLKEHVSSGRNLPVLIFPEGTCINNSAVMMFRKGSFEITDRVHPVAIKYDSRFGDPFWNSSKHTYTQYLLLMMSSWAIKCDVWYLPPMDRKPAESSAEFANRVKAEIARQGGLVDLAWDGQLKRSAPKELWKHQQQEDYARHLKLE